MKFIHTLIALLLVTYSFSQTEYKAPRLQKTAISNSGCYAYLPQGDIEFELSYSEDSSEVYTGEIMDGDFHYGIIVVKLKETVLETSDDKTSLLESYLDYLKTNFDVTEAVGYGEGHTMESNPDAIGVIDYWVDAEKDTWQIKGWADSNTIAVLMIYGPREYPNFNVQQLYLDGFRFY